MQAKIITLATPVFFALIFLELMIGWLRQRNTYRINDAINSLSLGVLSQIVDVFLLAMRVGIYSWLLDHAAWFSLPSDQMWVWLSGLLFYDLCYYWQHRLEHEVNILWAGHVVHHQSEDYNLSTALRQSSSSPLSAWIFYIPMALFGYPLEVFIIVGLIDLLYQFWVHTQQIDRLRWIDRILVTPSNHRVHHAVNDLYIDKNYGGILILWDRLFGTFMEEQTHEPVVYGTRHPLCSWNPLWANVRGYWELGCDAWRTQRLRDKFRLWLARPGWRPNDVRATWPVPAFELHHAQYHPPLSRLEQAYCLAQFTLVLLMTTHFLAIASATSWPEGIAYALWLGTGLGSLGGLMEGRPAYHVLEALRLIGTLLLVISLGKWFGAVSVPVAAQIVLAGVIALSLIALGRIVKQRFALQK